MVIHNGSHNLRHGILVVMNAEMAIIDTDVLNVQRANVSVGQVLPSTVDPSNIILDSPRQSLIMRHSDISDCAGDSPDLAERLFELWFSEALVVTVVDTDL
jgi:hypothetical protein